LKCPQLLGKVFSCVKVQGAADWRKLLTEELRDMYKSRKYSVQEIKKIGGACRKHGTNEKAYRNFMGKPEGREFFEGLAVDGSIILK